MFHDMSTPSTRTKSKAEIENVTVSNMCVAIFFQTA